MPRPPGNLHTPVLGSLITPRTQVKPLSALVGIRYPISSKTMNLYWVLASCAEDPGHRPLLLLSAATTRYCPAPKGRKGAGTSRSLPLLVMPSRISGVDAHGAPGG